MGQCERCGLSIKSPKRVMTGTHFGKPIYRRLCSPCRVEVKKENEKQKN